MRLFVAVDPPPEQRSALDATLGARDDQLRWVPVEQWHLTLLFCGDVDERMVPELSDRLARAAARTPAFPLQLKGAGTFPKQSARARVLWLGLGGDTSTLSGLAERCAAAARRTGIAIEDRAFRPHLTVARARTAIVDATDQVHRLASFETEPWQVQSVLLVHSTLGARVKHDVIADFPLDQATHQA